MHAMLDEPKTANKQNPYEKFFNDTLNNRADIAITFGLWIGQGCLNNTYIWLRVVFHFRLILV